MPDGVAELDGRCVSGFGRSAAIGAAQIPSRANIVQTKPAADAAVIQLPVVAADGDALDLAAANSMSSAARTGSAGGVAQRRG
jgi:hypothetical protein